MNSSNSYAVLLKKIIFSIGAFCKFKKRPLAVSSFSQKGLICAYFMENQEARAIRAERAAIKLGNQTARAAINLFVNRDISNIMPTSFHS